MHKYQPVGTSKVDAAKPETTWVRPRVSLLPRVRVNLKSLQSVHTGRESVPGIARIHRPINGESGTPRDGR